MVVVLPGVPDRYFSFQASDQYPRWFIQVGNQFTGRAAQQCLIVGPDFREPYPAGFAAAQVYQSSSNCVIMAVRYALKSSEPAELAAVNALQDRTTVAPLSLWEKNGRKAIRAEDQALIEPGDATVPRMADLVEIATSLTSLDLLQLVSLVLNDPSMTLRRDSAKEVATLAHLQNWVGARNKVRPGAPLRRSEKGCRRSVRRSQGGKHEACTDRNDRPERLALRQ